MQRLTKGKWIVSDLNQIIMKLNKIYFCFAIYRCSSFFAHLMEVQFYRKYIKRNSYFRKGQKRVICPFKNDAIQIAIVRIRCRAFSLNLNLNSYDFLNSMADIFWILEKLNVSFCKRLIDRLIDFNSISTCLGLFYALW